MVIGEREREWIFARYTGMATTLAGERIIKKQLLLDHMELFKAEGYLIESAINKLFLNKKSWESASLWSRTILERTKIRNRRSLSKRHTMDDSVYSILRN